MIIGGIFTPLFLLMSFLVGLLPDGVGLPGWLDSCLELVGYGLAFFPLDLWVFMIGNFIVCQFALHVWAVVEWVYKKIPGVD